VKVHSRRAEDSGGMRSDRESHGVTSHTFLVFLLPAKMAQFSNLGQPNDWAARKNFLELLQTFTLSNSSCVA
jgi:hypothetical protein